MNQTASFLNASSFGGFGITWDIVGPLKLDAYSGANCAAKAALDHFNFKMGFSSDEPLDTLAYAAAAEMGFPFWGDDPTWWNRNESAYSHNVSRERDWAEGFASERGVRAT